MSEPNISGLQEAQRWNARAIANMKPSGAFGRMIRDIVTQIQRAEMAVTHVDTGALRGSERMELRGLTGRTYIDESAMNPRSRVPAHVYAVFENARGDSHAFGERTANDAAPAIVRNALAYAGRSFT